MAKEKKHTESALKVNKGIDPPASVNPNLHKNFAKKFKKEQISIQQYLDGIQAGDRTIISKAITLIESTLPNDKEKAKELLNRCLPLSGDSFRLGITGVPGAGKSTFIETFGLFAIEQGKKVAVLAIDPASTRTKGSILGDKTRMEKLSTHPKAFIRPSSSAGTLGGVSRNTREAMIILEAAGFDFIIIETVGVGQSETAVAQMTDFFLLMLIAGAGDELQGIKRGIMEMADLILINKADGDNLTKAEMARRELQNALHLFSPAESGWTPEVLTVSALEAKGIDRIWETLLEYERLTKENGFFEEKRKKQLLQILEESIRQKLIEHFYANKEIALKLQDFKIQIQQGRTTPYQAAEELLNYYFGDNQPG